jgi:hypothetical protein
MTSVRPIDAFCHDTQQMNRLTFERKSHVLFLVTCPGCGNTWDECIQPDEWAILKEQING